MNKLSPRYDELSPERQLFINNLINSLASEPDRDPLDVIADRQIGSVPRQALNKAIAKAVAQILAKKEEV